MEALINETKVTDINRALRAAGIDWATAKLWEKHDKVRAYFNVGKQSDGYIEEREGALLRFGVSRQILAHALDAMGIKAGK